MLLDTLLPTYIFRQQMMIHIILIIICAALFSAAVILFFIKIKTAQAKSLYIGRMLLAVTSIFLLYFLLFFPELKNTLDLRSHGAAVMGKTVSWINTGDARMIEYSFTVNGLTYTKQCDVVYYSQEIENIQCPDGMYTVIYDSLDPKNAVMDFKSRGK